MMAEDLGYYSKKEYDKILKPLIDKIQSLHKNGKTIIVGIQGGQGTGKTTLAKFIKNQLLRNKFKVISFSIDDFYESLKNREKLSKKYYKNPYYQISRGLPGTHKYTLLAKTLEKIKEGERFEIPVFDKSLHDAKGDISKKKIIVEEKQDFILFEGWCLGIPAITNKEFLKINEKNRINLKKLDPTLKKHLIVLDFVKKYQDAWKLLDFIIMMKPDSIISHKKWRYKQEEDLKKEKGKGMSREQINDFVDIYLPFTYTCYEKLKSDILLFIDKNHLIYKGVIQK